MTRRRNALHAGAALLIAVALGSAAPPLVSAASEQQGAQVLSEVQAGKLQGTNLTSTQYQHVGQYLMSRALGSTESYEATDSLMDRMMGSSVSDQMYQYMGERYLGKSVAPNSSYEPYYGWMAEVMSRYGGSWAGMMGGYMMGAYRSLSGRGSVPYGGMMGGYGAGGSPGDPSGSYPLGPSMMNYAYGTSGSGGWPTAAIAAVALLGALLVVGAVAFLRPRLRGGRGGSGTAAAGHG
jgi:hypothetical protein